MCDKNSISFNDALKRSDYSKETIEKVKIFVGENISKYKDNSTFYLTYCFGKNIIVVKHCLNVEYKEKNYPIYLLIYLPVTFPDELRIYIHKIADLQINKKYTEPNIIDFSTLELYFQKIAHYTPLEDPITNLIEDVYNNFSRVFPLYKAQQIEEFFGPCYLNEDKTFLIDIQTNDLKEYNSLNEHRQKVIKKILNLINNKSFEIQQTSSELEVIENNINQKLHNNYVRTKSKENIELEKIAMKLKELESNLEIEVNNLKYKEKKSIFELCHEIINIKDKEKYKYTVMKKTIEDYLIYIKKAYEKKLINFDKCVDRTRVLSKELFFILYAIEKRNNMYN